MICKHDWVRMVMEGKVLARGIVTRTEGEWTWVKLSDGLTLSLSMSEEIACAVPPRTTVLVPTSVLEEDY